jgi:hypothetical protein
VNMLNNDSESNLSMGEETNKDNVSAMTNMDMVCLSFLVLLIFIKATTGHQAIRSERLNKRSSTLWKGQYWLSPHDKLHHERLVLQVLSVRLSSFSLQ